MALHWYVIHTYSGYEDKVKASIEEQFKAKGLSSAVGELRIPTEDVVEVKAGKKRVSKRRGGPRGVIQWPFSRRQYSDPLDRGGGGRNLKDGKGRANDPEA